MSAVIDSQEPPAVPRTPEFMDTQTISENINAGLSKMGSKIDGSGLQITLKKLQTWEDKTKSGSVLGLTCAVFYLTFGENGYNVLSVTLLLMALRMVVLKTVRAFLAAVEKSKNDALKPLMTLGERVTLGVESVLVIPSPNQVNKVVIGFASLIESRINKVCKYVVLASEPTEDGKRAFKFALAHLLVGTLALRFFSFTTLMFIYIVYQMTWPATYQRHKEPVDKAVEKAKVIAAPHIKKASEKMNELLQLLRVKIEELLVKAQAKAQPHIEKLLSKMKKKGDSAVSGTKQE